MDRYQWLRDIRQGGNVARFHTKPTLVPQSNAAHSWGVAMALIAAGFVNPNLLAAALLHDVAEVAVGDVPAPAKWANPALAAALSAAEAVFNEDHGISYALDDLSEMALAWADRYELCQKCLEERLMGNRLVTSTFYRSFDALGKSTEGLRAYGADAEQLDIVRTLNAILHQEFIHATE